VEVVLFCRRAFSVGSAKSPSGCPTENEAWIKWCLIVDASLWRLPPRFGVCRTAWLQLNSSNHIGVDSGLETTPCSKAARWEAQEGRADLGMCLITEEFEGDQMGVNRVTSSDRAELTELAMELTAGWSTATGVWLHAWRGGLLDPGHGSCRGPCLWTVPHRYGLAASLNKHCTSRWIC